MTTHYCASCRGTGKVERTERRKVHGKEKLYTFAVTCPGILVERVKDAPLSAQDRAAGEREAQ